MSLGMLINNLSFENIVFEDGYVAFLDIGKRIQGVRLGGAVAY